MGYEKSKKWQLQRIKNFHKSKIDGLQKLSTRAPQFLVLHNPFMMLFHILMSVLDHELMLDNFLITSSVIHK